MWTGVERDDLALARGQADRLVDVDRVAAAGIGDRRVDVARLGGRGRVLDRALERQVGAREVLGVGLVDVRVAQRERVGDVQADRVLQARVLVARGLRPVVEVLVEHRARVVRVELERDRVGARLDQARDVEVVLGLRALEHGLRGDLGAVDPQVGLAHDPADLQLGALAGLEVRRELGAEPPRHRVARGGQRSVVRAGLRALAGGDVLAVEDVVVAALGVGGRVLDLGGDFGADGVGVVGLDLQPARRCRTRPARGRPRCR